MMYANTIRPPLTFYHHGTHHFYATQYAQPRVGKEIEDSPFMPFRLWYAFRLPGRILGCLILFFALALFCTEIGRLYSGSNNRGRGNTNDTFEYLMYPDQAIGDNGFSYNNKPENRWMWPWSTATLLFGLIFIITGFLGIISGQRQTYSAILTFFVASIVSLFLLVFIIASYATIIAGWHSIYGTGNGNAMPHYPRIDRDLAIACLSIACVLILIIFASIIVAGIAIEACTAKHPAMTDNDQQQIFAPGTPQLMPTVGHSYLQRPQPFN